MKKRKKAIAGLALLLTVIMIGLAVFIAVRFQKAINLTEANSDAQGTESLFVSNPLAENTDSNPDSASDSTPATSSDEASESAAFSDKESASDSDFNSESNSDSETESEPDTEWVLELAAMEDTPVIWAGDSRTVGMQKALGSHTEDLFIGASGEGYTWLLETGMPLVEDAIVQYPDRPVIFNMGVNDYENIYNYLVLYADVTARYPDTIFYFLSVNPVDDEAGLYITNAQIEDFNAQIKDTYPDTYLDSYTYLIESEAGTIDGIHYSEEVYRMIYLFVKEAL